jgi:prepilin-type N-terminal cleavage/methylation domain-containing protein
MLKTKYPIFKSLHRGEKGLTLLELLIVVAILGILAAVIIPNVGAFMVAGRVASATAEADAVKTASLGFLADTGHWPTNSTILVGRWFAGTPRATYTICGAHGWLVSAAPIGAGWPGINFTRGADGPGGRHGTWVRPP